MHRMNLEEFVELIKSLAQTPAQLARALDQLSPEELTLKRADEFSTVENICHLRDLEIEGYGERIARMLEEDEPSLPDFDGARVALERNYNRQDVHAALAAFSQARSANLARAGELTPEQLERKAKLEGVGEITLLRLFELMEEHDQGHLDEVTILLQRRQSSSGAI